MEASIAARFGPPTARDLDTSGIGLSDGTPILPPAPPAFAVVCADDHGNRVEVTRWTSR
jgi:hypothetical protein